MSSGVDEARPIEAAGGLLWRVADGQVQVAVVHRPRYDDWSLPKGKAHKGETPIRTAVREVAEETGARVQVSRRLGKVRYRSSEGDKVVRYWAMHAIDGTFEPNAEVDELCWLDAYKARTRLAYASDRAVLDALFAHPLPTSVVVLMRHAKAGKRSEWSGSDMARPLERTGRAQARALAGLVSAFTPSRVLAANPVRCVQTVAPLASALDLSVELASVFADAAFATDPQRTIAELGALAAADESVAVCSQGITIAAILATLENGLARHPPVTAKGAAWVLGARQGAFVSADYYGAPYRGNPR